MSTQYSASAKLHGMVSTCVGDIFRSWTVEPSDKWNAAVRDHRAASRRAGLHASAKNYDMLKGDFQRFKAEAAQQNTALAAARAEVDRVCTPQTWVQAKSEGDKK